MKKNSIPQSQLPNNSDQHHPPISSISDNSQFNSDKLPDFRNTNVHLNLVKKGYFYYVKYILFLFFLFLLISHLFFEKQFVSWTDIEITILDIGYSKRYIFSIFAIISIIVIYFITRPHPVYLVNISTFKASNDLEITSKGYIDLQLNRKNADNSCIYSQESLDFVTKLLSKSCIGEQSYFPPGFFRNPVNTSLDAARQEAELVIFSVVSDILSKSHLSPSSIDILIVNCSLFCPTPSLSSMIVNHFQMKRNIKTYNLGGMGCSAGLISIDLAKDLLQLYSKSYCLIVSTENITQNWYTGNNKSFLITNTLFRMGGAAILLSNYYNSPTKPQFKLLHTFRTHMGKDQACFECIVHMDDEKGNRGVRLSKDIMKVAGDALKSNLTALGPKVLPWSEQIKFFANISARSILKRRLPPYIPLFVKTLIYNLFDFLLYFPNDDQKGSFSRFCRKLCCLNNIPDKLLNNEERYIGSPYIPDFSKAFQHYCIHAGGRGVLDAIEKNLNLESKYLDASRFALWRYGNTSSASIWYEMEYHIQHSNIKKGDNIFQLAFGSGFKCNSAVWNSLNSY